MSLRRILLGAALVAVSATIYQQIFNYSTSFKAAGPAVTTEKAAAAAVNGQQGTSTSAVLTEGTADKNAYPPLNRSSAYSVLMQPINLDRCKVHLPTVAPIDDNDRDAKNSSSPHEESVSHSTIVTAYFRIRSKHKGSEYDQWMSNFLSIQDNMVIFTEPDMVEKIQAMRSSFGHLNKTIIVEMPSLRASPISRLAGPYCKYGNTKKNKLCSKRFWSNQLDKDVEKIIHRSYRLFWVWLSKSWFVIQAIEHFNYVFESKFFMWSDIGCFRDEGYNSKRIVRYPEMVPDNTVLWEAHHLPSPPPDDPIFCDKPKHFYHSGSQGAGTIQTWKHFHDQFAKTVDGFLDHDYFIGEDQCILQAACLQTPNLCAYVPFDQVNDNYYFGLRYVLHNGPNSARTPDKQYNYWRPPGWSQQQ